VARCGGYSLRVLAALGTAWRGASLEFDPQKNRERVTHLMSALVGGPAFARAIDDPVASEAVLHSMRRHLRAEFVGGAANQSSSTFRVSGPPTFF